MKLLKDSTEPQLALPLKVEELKQLTEQNDQKILSPSPPALDQPTLHEIQYKELKVNRKHEAFIGQGSCSTVLPADYRGSIVAVKFYNQNTNPKFMLSKEALVMELSRSDYIVNLIGICTSPNYCLIMEYCKGGDLYERLHSSVEITLPEQLNWAMQISYGIDKLHSKHILHADLCSYNILLDERGRAKIADFGLSFVTSHSDYDAKNSLAQVPENFIQNNRWSAPELNEKELYSEASDVYSLGIILLEIVSRKLPFAKFTSNTDIDSYKLEGGRNSFPHLCPKIFRLMIDACLKLEPTSRPTAQQVGKEFAQVIKNYNSLFATPDELFFEAAKKIEYKELKLIGEVSSNSYSVIFSALYRENTVVVKRYDQKISLDKQKYMLSEEVKVMQQSRSKYIVNLLGICTSPPYCLVMEYYKGGDLYTRLHSDVEITLPEQLRWAMEISYGVDKLHSMHFLHKNLKSRHILLDERNHAKIAQILNSYSILDAETDSDFVNTRWCSPEVIWDNAHSKQSDVHSLGIILWEIVSRKTPYKELTNDQTALHKSKGGRDPLPSPCPKIFQLMIDACLNFDPKLRPTALHVGTQFAQVLKSLDSISVSLQEISPIQINSESKPKPAAKSSLTQSLTSPGSPILMPPPTPGAKEAQSQNQRAPKTSASNTIS